MRQGETSRTGSRPRAFGRASEEPYRRRASDWVRFVSAAAVLTGLATQATRISTFEENFFELFNSLPSGLEPLFRALQGLGALWAVGLIGAAALVARRWRLARDLSLCGLVAWAIARVLGSYVVGHAGLRASLRTLTRPGFTPSFPLVRLSILVAVVAAAGPYVGRPARRLGQSLVVANALSAMYLGIAFPKDLLGGLVLGWGVAAAVHLLFGSPGGRPTSWQLEVALAQIGIDATDISLIQGQTQDATEFECEAPAGPLRVKVIGRDEVDAQLLAKAWRSVVYKAPVPPLQLTRAQQVEHEACLTLLAGSAGVRVPDVLFVGKAGPNAALLVTRSLQGRRLRDVEASVVTDELLSAMWGEVAKLHGKRIAHNALDAEHVVLTDRGPALVGFATASTTGFDHRRAKDVADLLSATAAVVGDQRAVAACVASLGEAALVAAIPYLQPAALRRQTRSALRNQRGDVRQHLDALRRTAAEMLAVEPPALQQLQRVRTSSVVLAASSFVAIAVLLGQVGDPGHVWEAVKHAQWAWAAGALLLSLATNVPYAVALMGTLPLRLPLWPTTELELAMSYSNLVIPVIGGTGFQIRFLQRQGAELPAAVAAGGLLSAAGTVITQLPLFALAVWLSPDALEPGSVPVSGILKVVFVVVVIAGAAVGVGFGVPRLRRTLLEPVREAASAVWTTVRTPRLVALIVGGNIGVSVLYATTLMWCMRAFGGTLEFWTALALSIGIGTLAALIPVPGGATAVGSVGLAGALAALGSPTNIAAAATLANQLVVSYIPAVPGWFATRHLLRHDYL